MTSLGRHKPYPISVLQILNWRISNSTPILPNMLFPSILILDEILDILTVHMFSNLIRLPLLEREAQSFVRVIFVIRLVLVVLDTDEVRVHCFRVKRECDKRINSRSLGDYFECPGLELSAEEIHYQRYRTTNPPDKGNNYVKVHKGTYLLILELDNLIITPHNLVPLVLTCVEKLR